MGSGYHSSTRAFQSRRIAMAMLIAMRQVKGISVDIYGHSADQAPIGSGSVQMYDYISKTKSDISSLRYVTGRCQNCDGHAIKQAGVRLMNDYPEHDLRVLFVLSDGQPAASGYGGPSSEKHIESVCRMLKSVGVQPYGLAIDEGFDQRFGDATYGSGRYVVLPDVASAAPIMANFLGRITSRL
jgi:nitric oxide reductase activation protein